MGFTLVNELPTPAEILEQFPLADHLAALKKERDEEIAKVITGQSNKFLVIIGPCSADNEDAVCDYANRLAKVQEATKDKLIVIPRVYTNKPRTTGEGYMGMLHQPDPEKKPDMLQGILAIRHMHMRVLRETGMSTADEMLYPDNLQYLSDIMSYIAVAPFRGKPVPPSGGKRLRRAGRYEEPHQRRHDCYVKLCCCCPAPPRLYLPWR